MGIPRGRLWRVLGFLLLTATFLAPAAAILPTVRSDATPSTELAQASASAVVEGQQLYLARCAACHAQSGAGTSLGPSIVGRGPAWYDFMLSTGRMPVDRPVVQAARKPPAFDRQQIDALIAYLVTLGPGGIDIPEVTSRLGSLPDGQSLFQANCASCHGATGNGGAVGSQVAPSLHEATAVQIGEAVRIGPGTMPVFDQRTIDQQELNSLSRYVVYLRDPSDVGGAGLGHAGPIIEGFVALLIGLGSVVVVTRYIGRRA